MSVFVPLFELAEHSENMYILFVICATDDSLCWALW